MTTITLLFIIFFAIALPIAFFTFFIPDPSERDDYESDEDILPNKFYFKLWIRRGLLHFNRIQPSYCSTCKRCGKDSGLGKEYIRCTIPVLLKHRSEYDTVKKYPKITYKNMCNVCPDYDEDVDKKFKQIVRDTLE